MAIKNLLLHPDEDIRSIVLRYHFLAGRKGNPILSTNIGLFSRRSVVNSALPQNINYFSTICSTSSDEIIQEHTYLPLLNWFLNPFDYNNLLLNTLTNNFSRQLIIHSLLESSIMYCPECISEDYETFGEAYIHRIHQLRNISVCSKHNRKLISVCPYCESVLSISNKYQIVTKNCSICFNDVSEFYLSQCHMVTEQIKLLSSIAEEIIFLFSSYPNKSKVFLSDRFLLFGLSKGLVNSKNHRFNNMDIISELKTLIKRCDFEEKEFILLNDPKHFSSILFSSNMIHVFTQVLVMRIFAGSCLNFIKSNNVPQISTLIPFGNGPWICINEVCSSYGENAIKYCIRRYCHTTKRYVGTFKCAICDLTYVKGFKDGEEIANSTTIIKVGDSWKRHYFKKNQTDITRTIGKTKNYRKSIDFKNINLRKNSKDLQWFKSLIEIFEECRNYNEVSRRLGIENHLVKRYVNLYYKNNTFEIFRTLRVCKEYSEWWLGVQKEKVRKLRENHPEINRTKIIEILGSHVYKKILTLDPEWALENLPTKKINASI
ncbi:hypothetical protein QFZ81_003612 [Paenibacillus sp. V4I9]|uniref:TnsD family Tn7-like transposition protein n=1 Tax=Paenibacillus sp. V4I9 TaxID=3042308 RepID=UPI0027871737|nr:TnsD family Tn7-like transposition protein [Paenibacillus sp. V4I9]MDQ0888524.1 hypothetical protein [Paenibacillus sp. V4I9]